MDKVKVGIIGSGFIAEHHCLSYSQLPYVEIVGLSSLNEEEAKQLVRKYKKIVVNKYTLRTLASKRSRMFPLPVRFLKILRNVSARCVLTKRKKLLKLLENH